MTRARLPLILAVLGVVAWFGFGHGLAPWVSLRGAFGPALSPLLWGLGAGWVVVAVAGVRWVGPRLLQDLLAVGWMAWFGHAAYLMGGWPGVGALGALLPVLGAGGLAARVGRAYPAARPVPWAIAGVALCGPFVVLGPLALRWLVVEAAREWPIAFVQMPEQVVFFRDVLALFAAWIAASVVGVGCLGRAEAGLVTTGPPRTTSGP